VTLRHHFTDSPWGQLHYVEDGDPSAPLVLLLHQSPRSWDEYRDVIPLLADRFHVVAMDTLGFGWSAQPEEFATVERFAAAARLVVLAMQQHPGQKAHVVGHHTGGVVGIELAAAHPELVQSLVLSGVPWVDAPRRALTEHRTPIDWVEPSADGSHLLRLWQKREYFYPADRPDLLNRLVADALRVLPRVEEGHLAVNNYVMEERIAHVHCVTLVVCGQLDSFSLPDVPALLSHLPAGSSFVELAGVGVPSVDHDPRQFANVIAPFIATRAESSESTPSESTPSESTPSESTPGA